MSDADPVKPGSPAPPENSYDALPYESWAFDATHPDELAAMGALFGLQVPAPESARVLELGCAAGGNLIPMAVGLPGATFVGVDLSGVQIADGRETVAALGLTNVSLEHRSILDVGPDDGLFDYIVCHGVYSWVPGEVQDHILAICRNNLSPQGVAYVSYNTMPGWHLRAGVREMMTFHAERFTSVEDRVTQARAMLDFLLSAIPDTDQSAYARLLRDELGIIRSRADSYLFHEHLEEHNEPIYFHEFVRRLGVHELRYLAESSLREMFPRDLPAEVQGTLAKICPDQIHMEQYLDFLRNRMFRRTLICHADVVPEREISSDVIAGFYLGADLVPARDVDDARIDSDEAVQFQLPNGGTVQSIEPMSKRVLRELGRAWPAFERFDTLYERAEKGIAPEAVRDDRRERALLAVLECVSAGLIRFRLAPTRFASEVAERPVASRLARHQASLGSAITTLRHTSRPYPLDVTHLIQLLDGTRTHDDLAAALADYAAKNRLTITIDGVLHEDPQEVRELLGSGVPELLAGLCRDGVLVEPHA